MSANDGILMVAGYDTLRRLGVIADGGDDRVRVAAEVAEQALLALRDCVNRPNNPEVFDHRIEVILQKCSSLPPPQK